MISKTALIDVSADNNDSLAVQTDGMLLCGIEFPAAMTGNMVRVDPSGWAFASNGYLRINSDGSEAADRSIVLYFRHS